MQSVHFGRFGYQSSPTGSEGEISRPLDHIWQIPFIHSTRFISSNNDHIYNTRFQLFPPCGIFKYVVLWDIWQLRMRSVVTVNLRLDFIRYMLGYIDTKRWNLRMCIVHNLLNLIYIHYTCNQRRGVRFWRCTQTQTRGIWGNFLATFSKGHFNKWKNAKYEVKLRNYKFLLSPRKSTNFWSTHVRICGNLGTRARRLSLSLVHNMFSYINHILSSWSMTLANGIVNMSNLVPRVLKRLLAGSARIFISLFSSHATESTPRGS